MAGEKHELICCASLLGLLDISPCSLLIRRFFRGKASWLAYSPATAAAVTASEQPTKLKIHGNPPALFLVLRDWNKVVHQCCTAVWRYIPVRPVGTPTIIPVTSELTEESSSCKIHYRQSGVFLVGRDACHGRQGEKGEELRPNAVYAHDPALIPEQARGNMAAACTTTERERIGEGGSAGFGFTRCFPSLWLPTAIPPGW